MRFNSSIIGPKQVVSVSTANGMFSLAEQQQLQGSNAWPSAVLPPAIYSIYFDGSGDYLGLPNSSSLDLDGDFTIEFWLYLTSNPTDYQMLLGSSISNTGTYLTIGATKIYFQFGASGPSQAEITYTVPVNQWIHLACVRSSSTVGIYVNGVSQTVTNNTQSATFSPRFVGVGYNTAYTFPGYISNLRIIKGQSLYSSTFALPTTNYAVTANTSLLLGTSTQLTDASTYNHTITATGQVAPNTTYGPNIAASISLNGTTDYLALNAGSSLSLTGDFTVEFFARFSSLTSYRTPLTLASGSGGGENYLQSTTSGGTSFTWGGWASTNLSGGTGFSTNTWYHLALCRSGSTIRSFKDGALIATGTGSGTIPSSGGYVYIGSQNSTQWFFSGYISNLRILKGSAIYTAAFTPPSTNLTNITNTALLMGQYQAFALDFSNNAIASSKGGSTTYSTAVLPF